MHNVMEGVLVNISKKNQLAAASSGQESYTSSIDKTFEDLRVTMRKVEASATNNGRFVVAVVYLFAAIVIGLSLHVVFTGLP